MSTTNSIDRDAVIDDAVLNFIADNMPNNGYSTVATKLGYESRQTVRDEIIRRKKLYNSEIVNTCLEVIDFITGKKPTVEA